MAERNITTDERSVRRFGGWSIAMMQEKPTAEYVLASDYDAERLARLQAMIGRNPERPGSGFAEQPLADFIERVLKEHRSY